MSWSSPLCRTAVLLLLIAAAPACHGSASVDPPAPCTDDPASTYAAPDRLDGANGHILRCAHDGALAAADVDRIARTAGYVGDPLPSGLSIVRLLYRTERGTDPATAGFSSATVLLPDHPRAAVLPVVVVVHGTVGEAPSCPPSRESPTGDDTYLAELGYPLVGAGYAVILPDLAGYAGFGAAGNPPSGYHASADEAKSVLDAARALRAVHPAWFSAETVLVGHSQGGHAVLSALAMHSSYGSGGELVGVVAYAPSWFPMTSFAAILAVPTDYPLATESDTVAASVWYHYSHAELLDGPGAGPLLFAADKRDAIRAFVEQSCDETALEPLGTNIGDLFDPAFAASVSVAAALGTACPQDDVCTKWTARYEADRPHLTGDASRVPLLVVYGDADEWIPAERETCGFDRLGSDQANATVCIVAGASHDPVVGARSAYVSAWIAQRTLGGSDPGSCGPGREALVDDAGVPISCATPPPND
ncbi:MAG TPA: alpha/beta hydrolase [Polyangiaceae bacterium]|jgi:alpha-beta hydrolase superfamily lysophospholipase